MVEEKEISSGETEAVDGLEHSRDQSDLSSLSWQKLADAPDTWQSEHETGHQLDRIAAETESHQAATENATNPAGQTSCSDPANGNVADPDQDQTERVLSKLHDSSLEAGPVSSSEPAGSVSEQSEFASRLEARLTKIEAKLDKALMANDNEELLIAIEAQAVATEASRIEVLENGLAPIRDDMAAVRKLSEENTAVDLATLMIVWSTEKAKPRR